MPFKCFKYRYFKPIIIIIKIRQFILKNGGFKSKCNNSLISTKVNINISRIYHLWLLLYFKFVVLYYCNYYIIVSVVETKRKWSTNKTKV